MMKKRFKCIICGRQTPALSSDEKLLRAIFKDDLAEPLHRICFSCSEKPGMDKTMQKSMEPSIHKINFYHLNYRTVVGAWR